MTKPLSSEEATILSLIADIEKFKSNEKTRDLPMVAQAVKSVPSLILGLPVDLRPAAGKLAGESSWYENLTPDQERFAEDLAESFRHWAPGPR